MARFWTAERGLSADSPALKQLLRYAADDGYVEGETFLVPQPQIVWTSILHTLKEGGPWSEYDRDRASQVVAGRLQQLPVLSPVRPK